MWVWGLWIDHLWKSTFQYNFTKIALFSLGTLIWSWLKTWLFEAIFSRQHLFSFGDFDLIIFKNWLFKCTFTRATLFSLGTLIWSWLKTLLVKCNFTNITLFSLGTLIWSSLKPTFRIHFYKGSFLVWGLIWSTWKTWLFEYQVLKKALSN